MARLKQFTLIGEALELRGYHSEFSGENLYEVSMPVRGEKLNYEGLCKLREALWDDLTSFDMLATGYGDNLPINPLVVRMEKDWLPEAEEAEDSDEQTAGGEEET